MTWLQYESDSYRNAKLPVGYFGPSTYFWWPPAAAAGKWAVPHVLLHGQRAIKSSFPIINFFGFTITIVYRALKALNGTQCHSWLSSLCGFFGWDQCWDLTS